MTTLFNLISNAVKRCRIYTLSIFATYCISCFAGIVMTHSGNNFALEYRDKIVGQALKTDKASINHQKGNNILAKVCYFN